MVTLENLYKVYYMARKNKRRSEDAVIFEVNYEQRLKHLCDAINNRTYRSTANYSFISEEPKPREIFGCELECRIIQWYIVWRIGDIIESELTKRTFNNRVGMGTDAAIQQVHKDIWEVSNGYTEDAYIIQWDVKGYFPNADCNIIREQLQELIFDKYTGPDKEDLIWMVMIVVNSDPQRNCYRKSPIEMWDLIDPDKSLFNKPEGVGAAIGFLIFQTAMNLYLNEVDHWVVDTLGLHYTRFVDDTVIIVKDKAAGLRLLPRIREMYAKVGVTMHPRKFYCQHYSKGLRFLGKYIKFDRTYIANRTISRAYRKVYGFNRCRDKFGKLDAFISTVNSYLGLLKNANEYRTLHGLYAIISKQWKKFVCLNEKRLCIISNVGYKDRILQRFMLL